MATTTNFGWETPDDTDLVKDGAAAIRTALGGVDTSFVDLKGGTTGQILSKASNTDLDFVWTADAGSPTSYGFAAGKNKIINGDFGIWQRGTSFTNPANGAYLADRFLTNYDGTGSTRTVSQQTFTPGTAPVAGYEAQYFYRYAQTVAGSGGTYNNVLEQYIEDVRTFAGQTVTYSFWAKAASAASFTMGIAQNFGSGGSSVVGVGTQSIAVTTSWERYSYTVAIPSVAGKTIGTSSKLDVYVQAAPNTAFTLDIWGVQVEAGSTATAFQTATGTIQGELALCQRYFIRYDKTVSAYQNLNFGFCSATTRGEVRMQFPVFMRVAPSMTMGTQTGWAVSDGTNYGVTTTIGAGTLDTSGAVLHYNTTGLILGRACVIQRDNVAANTWVDLSAEL
jgi:hypothetical protein